MEQGAYLIAKQAFTMKNPGSRGRAVSVKIGDCALWSEFARKLGVCPECEGQEDEPLDLEEKLEILLEKA